MKKNVMVNGEIVPVKIEVRRIDKYNHILILDDVEHPISIALSDNLDQKGEKLFSHYTYKCEKVHDENGKAIVTDKGLVEFILNKR